MPDFRPHGARTLAAAVLLAAVVSLIGGCREHPTERGPSAGTSAAQTDGAGRRFIVEDGSGEPVAKLRERPSSWKVYDARFVPVGEVRRPRPAPGASEPDVSEEGGRPEGRLGIYRYGETERAPFERVRRGVWGISERFRIEQTGRGWAVFDAEANWIGRFDREPGEGWRLMRGRADESTWRVRREGHQWVVVSRGNEVLRGRAPELPPTVVLALALEELPVLDRVAVGVWLESRSEEVEDDGADAVD